MLRIRVLLLWLVVLALPLQGFAAASMLFCGPASNGLVLAQAVQSPQPHHHAEGAVMQAQHMQDLAGAALPSHEAGASHAFAALHKCSVCAACCNLAWMAEPPPALATRPLPRTDFAEPLVLIQAVPARLPEKPPRA